MANTLTPLMYTILARAYMHLRGTLVMPGIVNSDFAEEAKEYGDTIDVKVPAKMLAYDVVPGVIPTGDNASQDSAPTKVPIKLDQWKASHFFLTDKDQREINARRDFLPMQTIEAVDAIAEVVNANILGKYKRIYGFVATPGQTPFQDYAPPVDQPYKGTKAITDARAQLNRQKVPNRNRRFVMDPAAAGNALGLRAFQDASQFGSDRPKREGEIGRAFGFDIFEELAIPTHVAGTITTGAAAKAATGQAVGLKSVVFTTAATTGAVALKEGDIVTIAGSTQTHVVTEDVTQGSAATDFTLKIEPGLKVALTGGEALAVKASHVVNLAFHRFAFAFANRPLMDGLVSNPNIATIPDPVSGLQMRLEIKREHKRDKWEFDMLWGSELVIRDLAVRAAG